MKHKGNEKTLGKWERIGVSEVAVAICNKVNKGNGIEATRCEVSLLIPIGILAFEE